MRIYLVTILVPSRNYRSEPMRIEACDEWHARSVARMAQNPSQLHDGEFVKYEISMERTIQKAEVVKRFDSIGQVGYWVEFLEMLGDKPFNRISKRYVNERTAQRTLDKLVAAAKARR